jgi:PAS domain S-box-containing protein
MRSSRNISTAMIMIVTLVTVATLLLGLFGAFNYRFVKSHSYKQLSSEVEISADQLATALVLPVWNIDRDQINNCLASTMKSPHVYGIDLNLDGETIARGRGAEWQVVPVAGNLSGDNLMVTERTLTVAGRHIGSFRVFATPKFVEADLRRILLLTVISIVTLDLFFILSLYWVFWHIVLKPLKKIEQYALAVSRSATSATTLRGVHFRGELETVRTAIEEMITLLVARYDELMRSREDLHTQAVILEQEIAVRQHAEEAQKESEKKARAILDHSFGFIGLLAPDGTLLEVNQTALEFAGVSGEDVVGKPFWETPWWLHAPEEQRRLRSAVLAAAKGEMVRYETNHIAADGTAHTVDFSLKPVRNDFGTVFMLIPEGRDITEHKLLEEQLRQAQKMESIGRLAGGVAHDFNNMLTVIMASAEMASRKVAGNDALVMLLKQILKAAERSSQITRQLLAFSRKQVIAPKPVNLNALIIESEKILTRLISEDVKLSFRPGTGLWTIMIDPSQVDQVLMNLAVNARDAMPNGGSLVLETANTHIGSNYSQIHLDAHPGDYVQLTVSDTGIGMDQETQKHIFEPFFTTKGVGEGTGLGLATVYGIVSQNNGFITVYSEPGQGTSFTLHFPRHDEVVAPEASPLPLQLTGSGTILLVEDEEMLLWTTSKMLEELGYTVIQANGPREGIAICEQQDRTIDLILTDVVMPQMNGREMVERINAIRPGVKVLFMSGYTSDIVTRRGSIDECMHFIQKPLDTQVLSETISNILAGGP